MVTRLHLLETLDYREFIKSLVDILKNDGQHITYEKMAGACRIEKAYLSKVLSGKAHFNQDQIYALSNFLELEDYEQKYLSLLLEIDRTGIESRRVLLRREAKQIRDSHIRSEVAIKRSTPDSATSESDIRYFFEPYAQIVHLALLIPRCRDDLTFLASELGLPMQTVHHSIAILEKMGFVKRSSSGFDVERPNLHLPVDSGAYKLWRHTMRIISNSRLAQLQPERAYAFSAAFTASQGAKEEIKIRFMRFLNEVRELAEKSTDEQCLQINFDLFPWIESQRPNQ